MSCRPTPVDLCRNISPRRWGRADDPDFHIPGAKNTGRLHFFFHCPKSPLPVRDVLGIEHHGTATEPHIEKCAENYCQQCLQQNIVGFLKSEEKYLFLFTTCRNGERYGKRFLVGYITKREAFFCTGHGESWWSVQGVTKLVSFEDAYLLDRPIGGPYYKTIKFRKLDDGQTAKVLAKLGKGRSILDKCKAEIKRLLDRADSE
jgi:hypothetical protein